MTDLPIPLAALEDCGAILGRRGAGKSGTGRVLFEHELDAGHRCCAIDPKGDWWGIRMDKEGRPSGFDIPIFGGAHGDLALSEDMGEMLGRLVATHDLSCVVDLSAFPSQAAQRRFARDFAEALFEHNTQPITLFVDEADQLAPQRVPAEMARLLHAMETLIRLGRQRGIFMWMLTQRPQVLNKNLLSQADSLVAMKVTTPHDRAAIRDWMNAHDPDQAKAIEQQLAKLDVGEAFAWVPAADFLERVRFPLFRTYDSGRTPKHGETIAAVELPRIDLSAVEQALASSAAEEAGYPDDAIPAEPKVALLKGAAIGSALKERDDRIAQLEAELATSRGQTARLVAAIEKWNDRVNGVVLDSWRATLNKFFDANNQLFGTMSAAGLRAIGRPHSPGDETIYDWFDESQANAGAETSVMRPIEAEPASRPAARRSAAPPPPEPEQIRSAEAAGDSHAHASGGGSTAALPAQAQKMADMLDRIAPARVTWASLAAMVKLKPRGGHFNAGRKALRASGRVIEEGETVRSATKPKKGLTHDAARQLWKDVLKNPAPLMVDALYANGAMTRAELGAFLGIADHGGHFNGGVAQLVRNGVAVDVAGKLQLAQPLPGEKP